MVVCLWPVNRQAEPDRVREAGGLTAAAPEAEAITLSEPKAESADNEPAGEPARRIVEGICGRNAHQRLRELAASPNLSGGECEALYRFLREQTTDEKLERMASIKNDVMNILAVQSHLSAPWDELLLRIYEDEGQHPVIRDYALQHLSEYYEEATQRGEAQGWEPMRRVKLQEVLWGALEHRQESFAGTALLALCHLSGLDAGIDRGRVAQKSVELLEVEDTGELARMSALQVAALCGEPRVLPQAIATAQAAVSVPLRVSAVAAVGALGGEEELALLRRFQSDPNPSIRVAAAAASRRIQSRIEG
jgi:hypothetical protein